MEKARRVDLDYNVQGPALFTHVDVKNPVGSKTLKKIRSNYKSRRHGV